MSKIKRYAMLDTLLKAEQNGEIDDEGIRDEVDTFIFAGHDTISAAITFTLFVLAQHLEVQEKILDEINETKSDSISGELTMNDLNSMRYLDCVVKECLRTYTPVPIISRRLTEDVDMSKKIDDFLTITKSINFRRPHTKERHHHSNTNTKYLPRSRTVSRSRKV